MKTPPLSQRRDGEDIYDVADTAGRLSVCGRHGSPGPRLHLQGEASTQAESRSARGEPETHLRLNTNTREAMLAC